MNANGAHLDHADYFAIALFAVVGTLAIATTVRGDREARRAIADFTSRNGLRRAGIRRQWIDWGPFGNLHWNKSVFKVRVTDATGRTFAAWFLIEHDLLGGVRSTEAKFEHVDRP